MHVADELALATSEYVPAGQEVHSAADSAAAAPEYVPAGQEVHAVAPGSADSGRELYREKCHDTERNTSTRMQRTWTTWHARAWHDRKQNLFCASKKSTSPNRLVRTNTDPCKHVMHVNKAGLCVI